MKRKRVGTWSNGAGYYEPPPVDHFDAELQKYGLKLTMTEDETLQQKERNAILNCSEMREYARRVKNYKYVPEWMLEELGLQVNPTLSPFSQVRSDWKAKHRPLKNHPFRQPAISRGFDGAVKEI